MTLRRMAYMGSTILLVLLVVVFLGNQRLALAEEEVHDPGLPSECSDLIDNDSDGLTDFVPLFGDPDCESIFDTTESGSSGGGDGGGEEPPLTQCMDGIDNDTDGLIDLADPDCENVGDNSESSGNGGGGEEPVDACPNEETDPGVQTAGPCNADDVCPDMEGIQTSPDDCPTGIY